MQGGKPITEVAQLGDWTNIESLYHYSVPSIKQQEEASHTISSVMIPEHNMVSFVSDKPNMCVSQKSNVASNKIKPEKEKKNKTFSMFHGAIINCGTINVHIVTGRNKRKKHA